jgi:hypothetical protein
MRLGAARARVSLARKLSVILYRALVQFPWRLPILGPSNRAAGRSMARFLDLGALFDGRHFDREVVVLCVRRYLRFKLSFRDLVEMMAERGLSIVHTTIMRWVNRYAPEFERRWNRFARPAGHSWPSTRPT